MRLDLELPLGLRDVMISYLFVHAEDQLCTEVPTRAGASKSFTSRIALPPGLGATDIIIDEDMKVEKTSFTTTVEGKLPVAEFTSTSTYHADGDRTTVTMDISIEYPEETADMMKTLMKKFIETYVVAYIQKIEEAHARSA